MNLIYKTSISNPTKELVKPLKGKASVRHYLNTKLKPLPSFISKEKRYPVYLRIGFSKKQTDIKSQFIIFAGDIDVKDPIDIIDFEEDCSLSENEFKNIVSEGWAKAFEEEQKAISEAIQFIGGLGFNPLEHNPAHVLNPCIWTIHTVVSRHLNSLLEEEMRKDHVHLSLIIKWDWMRFDHLYRTLDSYGHPALKEWLLKFKPLLETANLVNRSIDENARVYQWNLGLFGKEKNLDERSIEYIREAIIGHYSVHLKITHPLIFKELKKIL